MTLFQPVRFGKYYLLDKIATGGWAELYQGKLTGVEGFEKLIAIKMILPHLAGEKELIDCFIVEAKLAALLNHKNIVQIYDFGNIEGNYFIAMQYLSGKDLRQVVNKAEVKENALDLEYRLYIVSLICSGLAYAHSLKDLKGNPLNLIHRDITPQNILITYDGEVKIVDFGIAKAAARSTLTQIGTIKGKVAYMSPEQADGRPIDHRSDVFSTGILLYELVTGQRMFKGDTMEILAKVRECRFDSPESVHNLPEQVYNILNRALEKEPDRRYQSCGEMLADLEKCMDDLSMRPRASGLSLIMSTLFKEEMIAEEAVMQRGADTNPAAHTENIPAPGDTAGETVLLDSSETDFSSDSPDREERPARRFIREMRIGTYAATAGVLVMMLLLTLTAVFTEKPDAQNTSTRIVAEKKADASITSQKGRADMSNGSVFTENEVQKAMDVLKLGKVEEAAHLFEKALAEDPALQNKISEYYLKALKALASEYPNNPEKVKPYFMDAVRLGLDNVQTRFQLGLLFIRLKEFDRAVDAYKNVTELNGGSHSAFFNMGYAYARMKKYEKAEKMYARAADLDPSYKDQALYNLAVMQYFQKKNKSAVHNLKKALAINPDNEKAKRHLEMLVQKKGKNGA
ncbi:MAG: protein kinase [Desulfarculaceae bacterium]|nr:protein kinase [Desulfarculaceae bacterium]